MFLPESFFPKKKKKRLDMPHGGIVGFFYPVECFLIHKMPLPPKAAHIPMSRLF